MSAATMDQEPEAIDIVDELLGEAPEDHPDDLPSADTEEDEPEDIDPVEAKGDEPEEPEEEEPAEEEEPGNLRLPESEEPEAKVEVEELELTEDQKKLAASEKREAGMQAELKRLRASRRQAEAPPLAPVQQVAPPVAPAPSVPDANDGRIPVVVSEDGQTVYVDQDKLSAQMQASARSVYEDAMRPTPDQVRHANNQQLAQSFISENPDKNQPIFDMAQKAADFISTALVVKAREENFQPRSIEDLQWFLKQSGISDQVTEFFPDIAGNLDEFVAAYESDNAAWKRSVLSRISPTEARDSASVPGERVEPLGDAPVSLARKGSTRSISPNADQSSFDALEREFQSNAFDFPEKKYKQMQALGKKLGMTGMD